MQITTKFGLGDTVTPIAPRPERVTRPCETCNGEGRVTLLRHPDQTVRCPNAACDYGRVHVTVRSPWRPREEHTSPVGVIKIEAVRAAQVETRYMIAATGVGSGQLWAEADLFATPEEAHAECERRNGAVASAEG